MVGVTTTRRRVWEGSDPEPLARVVGRDASVLQTSGFAGGGIDLYVYQIGDPVAKYSAVGINVSSGQPSGSAGSTSGPVIHNTPLTDGRWTADDVGFNFSYVVRDADMQASTSFSFEGGKAYALEFIFHTTLFGDIIVMFEYDIAPTHTK